MLDLRPGVPAGGERPALVIVSMLLAGVLASAPIERTRILMGTTCDIVAHGAGAQRGVEAAFAEIARLDRVMSSWREDSDLSRWNASAGGDAACPTDLFAVLDSSAAMAALTEGCFDPTVDPLLRAWDLRGAGRVPTPDERARALALVDWRGLRIDRAAGAASLAAPGMAVDLGGIGKGYALDRAAAILREAGVERALLNFGGEVLAIGAWPVSIAGPRDRLEPIVEIEVRGAAVSTSAQSERGFIAGGRRYGHVLDPRSGAPVDTRASVTAIAASGTRADAISTALLVMGRERAAEWCRRHPDVGALWLEPAARRRVRAWAWNVSGAATPGATVEWMQSSSAAHAAPSP